MNVSTLRMRSYRLDASMQLLRIAFEGEHGRRCGLTSCPSNSSQDPAIKSMAEQIATDPNFVQMGAVLKKSFAGMMQPVAENEKPKAPAFYMAQMASMLDQPDMQKISAEIGQKVIDSDPNLAATVDAMQDPAYRARIADTLQDMMDDPELRPMLEELEKFGPMAMVK